MPPVIICAGHVTENGVTAETDADLSQEGVCQGDSGGGLIHDSEDNIATVFGVVSFGVFQKTCLDAPAGFARVSTALQFIYETSGVTISEAGGIISSKSSGVPEIFDPTSNSAEACLDRGTSLSWTENPVEEFDAHCLWKDGRWGESLICPTGYVVTGICGSGGNDDCGGWGSGVWHRVKCCKINPGLVPELGDFCGWVTHDAGNEKMLASCPNTHVAVGRCGSGRTSDCRKDDLENMYQIYQQTDFETNVGSWDENWTSNHHAVLCCNAHLAYDEENDWSDSENGWRKGQFGHNIECPVGYVVTGACGSADFQNCQDIGPPMAGWYGTAIRCQRWMAMGLVQ